MIDTDGSAIMCADCSRRTHLQSPLPSLLPTLPEAEAPELRPLPALLSRLVLSRARLSRLPKEALRTRELSRLIRRSSALLRRRERPLLASNV